MATIVTRAGKGSPLTNNEVDQNFINLNTAKLEGTVAIASGGTGQITQQAAINALAGAVTTGQYLRGNGTNVVMSAIQAGDVPTLNQNTTGTAANVTGTVAIANGGTGQTTKLAAFDALSPATTKGDLIAFDGTDNVRLGVGTNNFVLTADSTTATGLAWKAAAGGVTTFSGGTTGLTPSTATSGAVTLAGTLALANGGTGASLTDPNADRILFWDDSAGAVTWLTAGTGLSISGTTLSSTATGTVTSVSGTGTVNGISLSGTVTTSGSLTLSGSVNIDGTSPNNLQPGNTWLVGYAERVINYGDWSGPLTVNMISSNWVRFTATGAISFNLVTSGVGGAQQQDIWMLEINNGGAHTITWPTTTIWAGGTPPTLTASGKDLIAFTKWGGNSTWLAFVVGKDIK